MFYDFGVYISSGVLFILLSILFLDLFFFFRISQISWMVIVPGFLDLLFSFIQVSISSGLVFQVLILLPSFWSVLCISTSFLLCKELSLAIDSFFKNHCVHYKSLFSNLRTLFCFLPTSYISYFYSLFTDFKLFLLCSRGIFKCLVIF